MTVDPRYTLNLRDCGALNYGKPRIYRINSLNGMYPRCGIGAS